MNTQVGISGFGVYVPPYRVNLRTWCDWTGNPWSAVGTTNGCTASQNDNAMRAVFGYYSCTIIPSNPRMS